MDLHAHHGDVSLNTTDFDIFETTVNSEDLVVDQFLVNCYDQNGIQIGYAYSFTGNTYLLHTISGEFRLNG